MKMIMIMGFINQLISRLQPAWLCKPPDNNPTHYGFVSRGKGLPDPHDIGPTLEHLIQTSSHFTDTVPFRKVLKFPMHRKKNTKKTCLTKRNPSPG